MAKSYQFLSYAEAVDEMRPDIVGIDANEPKIDGYSAEEMTFFKQRVETTAPPRSSERWRNADSGTRS